MCHKIHFSDVENDWFEAIPLGNGKFGGMIYCKNHLLTIVLNHYDLYYKNTEKKGAPLKERYSLRKKRLEKVFEENLDTPYQEILNPQRKDYEPLFEKKNTIKTMTIELSIKPTIVIQSLTLLIEKASVELVVQSKEELLVTKLFTREIEDQFIIYSENDLRSVFDRIKFIYPSNYEITNEVIEPEIKIREEGHLFGSILFERIQTRNDNIVAIENSCHWIALSLFKEFTSDFSINKILEEHQEFWDNFWKSNICLPDKFLETIWYLYLYLIKASNGNGSLYQKQATGLNGLWDAKNESLWGSMWYWDVNIQSTFWSTYSSNQKELAYRFCESYLEFEEEIKEYSRYFYGSENWAIDYPHSFYNCIQPWCAQFLYWYDQYFDDRNFLKKVKSVFISQCNFILEIFPIQTTGVFFPDISPEQGPITKDATTTIAVVKNLFFTTIELLKKLNEKVPKQYELYLKKLPDYPLDQTKQRLIDSPYTNDNQWLRHPSLLMPIFPMKEKEYIKGGKKEAIALNTVDYACQQCETGMFGVGWIASAYAQLGEGDKALRTIYEKGLDLFIHTNGLPYEETDRWLNLCLITKPPIHLPAMMEPTGGITNAINEMLLQFNGENLRLFPAIPKGKQKITEGKEKSVVCWETCSFENLLTINGHQVSAQVKDNQLIWLKIDAGKNQMIHVIMPHNMMNTIVDDLVLLEKGKSYEWGNKITNQVDITYPLERETATFRKLFLGKNALTLFQKKVDWMIRPYYQGATWQYPMTVYKFDFGGPNIEKNYSALVHRQVNFSTPQKLVATGFRKITDLIFTLEKGYGFKDSKYLNTGVTMAQDELRNDFIYSSKCNQFILQAPQGKYTLLIGLGGAIKTETKLSIGNQTFFVKLKENEFEEIEIPFIHYGDDLSIKLSCGESPWGITFLILNKERINY